MESKELSVVVPIFNTQEFLPNLVRNLKDELPARSEVIFVDNKSTDNSLHVIKELCSSIPCDTKIVVEKESGAPAARNTGCCLSRGKWVKFLDSDDLMIRGALKRQVSQATEMDIDILTSAYITDSGAKRKTKNVDAWVGLGTFNLGITSAMLWRRELFKNLEGFDTSLTSNQETELIFTMLKNGAKLFHETEPSVLKNERDNGITATTPALERAQLRCEFIHRVLAYIEVHGLVSVPDRRRIQSFLLLLTRHFASLDFEAATNFYDSSCLKKSVSCMAGSTTKENVFLAMYRVLGFRNSVCILNTLGKFGVLRKRNR